ncbi:MAG: restriction endonuclease subunit S [Leuconostoc mesenteroides]|jgi:type I restriction enzyme S subunit|uniref:restriction endonuclease subunit S n=2 Tax=Leuconostoc mesenteroides TaxID=1245 RepID=UPI0021C08656|nr:restriction endonuclease subunit S [Leuconostoc mesenteroides]MCH3933384.1 restriction endonuclease subunit S [Leuconostoc mesenteroides]MCI1878255.1 restriction endonuclease subunit S [Leuconostoc mesenteroides]MCI1907796.1 restriction endonuclease subunit S [Leuconostoc mesenteroides]MCT8391626.1 restriction endonuclease subunit S [Leuconostoc mesenteroides]
MTDKTMPALRFRGFYDAWEQRKLGDLTNSFEYGLNASAKKFDGIHKYIRITDIDDSSRKFNSESITSPDIDFSSADNYELKQNDLLFARTGASVGKSYIYTESDGLVYYAGFLIRVRIKPEFDSNFVFQNTFTSSYENFIRITSQRSGQPGVNAKEYASFEISIPSLEEQQMIGSLFKQFDNLITQNERKIDLLKQLKQAYLQKIFSQELRFAGFSDAWKECELGEVFDTVTDYVANGSFESLRNNVKSYTTENYAYMIRLQDASNDWKGPWLYTDQAGYLFLSKSKLYSNDIIMSNVGSVGKFFLVPDLDKPMTLAPNAVLIKSSTSNNLFLYQMMIGETMQSKINKKATPGVQSKINKTDFKKITTKIPQKKEQQKIGTLFKQLDNLIALHQQKLNLLKKQKQAFLQKMFI